MKSKLQYSLMTLSVAALALVQACGRQSNGPAAGNSGNSGAPALTPIVSQADITAGTNLNTTQQSDVVTVLQGNSAFYVTQPKSAPSACDAVAQGATVKATATTVTIAGTYDMTACMNQAAHASSASGGAVEVTWSSVKTQLYAVYNCNGADVSSLDGMPFLKVESNTAFTKCTTLAKFENTITTAIGTTPASADGTSPAETFNSRDVTYVGTAGLGACSVQGVAGAMTYDAGCLAIDKSDVTSGSAGQTTTSEDFTKLGYLGVSDAAGGGTWHAGGQMAVTYDNWTGTVTFTGAQVAPTYQLTPSGGAAVSGSLTPSNGD